MNSLTGVTNIALIIRSNVALRSDEVDAWCKSLNDRSGGKLFLGELLIVNVRSSPNEVLDCIPRWPYEAHEVLMRELLVR